jgi:hypothetical protein
MNKFEIDNMMIGVKLAGISWRSVDSTRGHLGHDRAQQKRAAEAALSTRDV